MLAGNVNRPVTRDRGRFRTHHWSRKKKKLLCSCFKNTLINTHGVTLNRTRCFCLGAELPSVCGKKKATATFHSLTHFCQKKRQENHGGNLCFIHKTYCNSMHFHMHLSIHPLTSCGSFNRGTLNFNRGFLYSCAARKQK